MSPGVPTKVIAASMGLSAFAVALVAGLAADNPLHVILFRAIVAMAACQAVGLVIGAVGEKTVADGVAAYKRGNPVSGTVPAPAQSGISAASPGASSASPVVHKVERPVHSV